MLKFIQHVGIRSHIFIRFGPRYRVNFTQVSFHWIQKLLLVVVDLFLEKLTKISKHPFDMTRGADDEGKRDEK